MSEFEMTSFEARFERRVQAYADVQVRDFDATQIAHDAVVRSGVRLSWPSFGRMAMSPSYLLIITGLLLALVVAIVAASLLLNTAPRPIARNGLVAYQVHDMDERPYNHIHLMNADGTNDREIAQGTNPRFSADGKWLTYFTGWGTDDPSVRIVRANADGSSPREVSEYQQLGYAFSPDASQLVVRLRQGAERFGGSVFWLIDVESGDRRELLSSSTLGPDQRYWDMAWSPDGKSVALNVMQQVTSGDNMGEYREAIDVLDVESGALRRITARPGTDSPYLAWSPDSKYIVYNGVPDGVPAPYLDPTGQDNSTFWPPLDLYVAAADGSSDFALTTSSDDDRDPRWSPDSKSIAYQYWDSKAEEVVLVVQGLDGTRPLGEPRAFRGVDGLAEVLWSPDSQTLLVPRSQELASSPTGGQRFRSWIEALDPDSDEPPTSIATIEHSIGSLTWQWLEP